LERQIDLSTLLMLDLPDEMIEYILTFVKDRDIGRCRQVNRRLYQIANDPHIVKRFPHISVDGSLYLKEQAYFTPTLRDRILTTTETNDLEWLVSRTTPIFREVCNNDIIAWVIMMITIWDVSGCIASKEKRLSRILADRDISDDLVYHAAWNAAYDSAWGCVVDVVNDNVVGDAVVWSSECDLTKLVYEAISCVVGQHMTIDNNIKNIVKDMNITDSWRIGSKCYQISECRVLLAINKTLLSRIKDIIHLEDINISLPDVFFWVDARRDDGRYPLNLKLKDNPWIIQYRELFKID
jgi:hypothetical protein